ncbi:hypothetical protein J6G99_05485 [bacterium]|nr:hypothetical protein [bacterium]
MRISAISFGNKQTAKNKETMENEALVKLWKYWQTTGDFRPAKIDFYEEHPPVITMIGEKTKTKQILKQGDSVKTSFFQKFIKKIFNLVFK